MCNKYISKAREDLPSPWYFTKRVRCRATCWNFLKKGMASISEHTECEVAFDKVWLANAKEQYAECNQRHIRLQVFVYSYCSIKG